MNKVKRMQQGLQAWKVGRRPKQKPIEKNLIKRYGLDTNSRKEAIHMTCFYCQGGDKDNMPDLGRQKEIKLCGVTECPLHKWRPYQKQ